MPPLCKRTSDLPQLLEELLVRHQHDGQGQLRVTPAALAALVNYSWPGNIRELSNLVERLAILHPSGEIGVDDLPKKYGKCAGQVPVNHFDIDTPDPDSAFQGLNLRQHLQDIERDLIKKAMHEADCVVAQAARLLNMRRTTLVEKLDKFDIH